MQNSIFIAQENSQCLGLKKKPDVNMIDFFGFLSMKFRKKTNFLYMNENYIECHEQKTTCKLMYIEKEKSSKTFIYKKLDTFQKARQCPLRFYLEKAIHLTLRDCY